VPQTQEVGHEIPEIRSLTVPLPGGNLVVLLCSTPTASTRCAPSSPARAKHSHTPVASGPRLAKGVVAVRSVPGGRDVSIVSAHTAIGPSHLTHYGTVHGQLVPFPLRGVSVPERYRHGGLPLAANLTLQNTGDTGARTTGPRPSRHQP
jgi:hypothetical protein